MPAERLSVRGKTGIGSVMRMANAVLIWESTTRECPNKHLEAEPPTDGWRPWRWCSMPVRSLKSSRRRIPHQVRYLAGFYDLDELGLHWRRQAAQVGWDEAERQIPLTDGAPCLENFIEKTHRSRCESSISITPANMSRN